MSELKIEGTIKKIFNTQEVSPKFSKRVFILETKNEQYPQSISFECQQGICSILDHEKEGNEVIVHFNLRGREWVNKSNETVYFNTLVCWRLEGERKEKPKETVETGNNDAFNENNLPF